MFYCIVWDSQIFFCLIWVDFGMYFNIQKYIRKDVFFYVSEKSMFTKAMCIYNKNRNVVKYYYKLK